MSVVRSQICEALVRDGVTAVFGLLGDSNLHLGQQLATTPGVRLVSAAHEASAVAMAEGFARASGRLGVATVTRGPGLTNALTALTEAVRKATPLLLVVGDTSATDPDHPQAIDHRALVVAAGAGFETITCAQHAATVIDRALHRAHHDRRPVVLNVPMHVQAAAAAPPDAGVRAASGHPAAAGAPDADTLDEAVGIMASAHRPLVLAGWGAVQSDAGAALRRLAERLGAPVATTLMARGLFAGDTCDLGVFGTLSTPTAVEVIAEADCVVAFGASLNRWTTADGAYLENRAVVQVDDRPERLLPGREVDRGVVGDARTTATTMHDWLDAAEVTTRGFRARVVRDMVASPAVTPAHGHASNPRSIDPRTLTHGLEELLPADRTVAVDAGRFMSYLLSHLHVPEPRGLIPILGFAPIGLSVATALGAGVASDDRTAVAVVGDGGFMLGGIADLQAAVREGIDLVVVVYDDGAYGAEHTKLVHQGVDPAVTRFVWPDLAAVANSLGARGVTVRTPDDLATAKAVIAGRDRPVLVDCHIDPDLAARIAT